MSNAHTLPSCSALSLQFSYYLPLPFWFLKYFMLYTSPPHTALAPISCTRSSCYLHPALFSPPSSCLSLPSDNLSSNIHSPVGSWVRSLSVCGMQGSFAMQSNAKTAALAMKSDCCCSLKWQILQQVCDDDWYWHIVKDWYQLKRCT